MARLFLPLVVLALVVASCSEDDNTYDPYTDWASRNGVWYAQVVDSARTAIVRGDTTWKLFPTFEKAQTTLPTDSVCVHVLAAGPHAGQPAYMPLYTDTVRLAYRGYLMPATYASDAGGYETRQEVFTQTYFGAFSWHTAAPTTMAVASGIEGFATALQHMTPGDRWAVYIPQQLAYGSNASGVIPAYSTLRFDISLFGVGAAE